MSAVETTPSEDETTHDDDHDHPSDGVYVRIALILAALTAVEVSTYFLEDGAITADRDFLVPMILIIMVVKFAIVALYFMHLKFDDPLLSRIFLFGLTVAVAVFVVMLSAEQFWDDSGIPDDYEETLELINSGSGSDEPVEEE